MTDQPILCEWSGEGMRPFGGMWAKRADRQWIVGVKYLIEVKEERSMASHRAYFAALNEAFMNLREDMAERFSTSDALRKYALIRTGFRDERSIICSSAAEARRVAAFVRPLDEFAVVSVSGAAVVVLTAKSQSMRAMGKADFQRSKDAVLGFVSSLIGTTPEALEREVAA